MKRRSRVQKIIVADDGSIVHKAIDKAVELAKKEARFCVM
jgi:hypothetical protein